MSNEIDAKTVHELDELFHEMMMKIGQASDGGLVSIVNKHELTLPQMITLDTLARGSQTVTNLSDVLQITPGAVSRLVDQLVRRQLVTRKEGDDDRRRKTLSLTKKGRLVRDQLDRVRVGSFTKAMSGLDRTLAADFRDVLRRVVTVLCSRYASPNGMDPSEKCQPPIAPTSSCKLEK
jgi:DNA-binding MarR family transcriptional regulator